ISAHRARRRRSTCRQGSTRAGGGWRRWCCCSSSRSCAADSGATPQPWPRMPTEGRRRMRPDQRVRGVPDGEVSQRALRAWRARGWRRWGLAVAGEAALWAPAAGVATAAVVGRPLAAVIATAAVLAWRVLADATFRDVRRMLHATEEAWPALGNALMAWHEADRGMLRVSPVFRDRLAMQARGALPDAWPAPRTRHEWTAALAALALAVALAVSMPYLRGVTDAERHEPVEAPGTEVQPESVSVIYRITPPAYTRRPPVEAEDVATIEAVVGSGL